MSCTPLNINARSVYPLALCLLRRALMSSAPCASYLGMFPVRDQPLVQKQTLLANQERELVRLAGLTSVVSIRML